MTADLQRPTNDLADWLLEQIAEDERIILAALKRTNRWRRIDLPWWRVKHGTPEYRAALRPEETLLAVWDPDRLLADCESNRRMVELHRSVRRTCLGDEDNPAAWRDLCPTCGSGEPYEYPEFSPCDTLKLLALPYASRDGYVDQWRLG